MTTKNLFLSLVFIASLITTTSSCTEKCKGSAGGNITVVASPNHHGDPVRPYSAWVKFDTKDSPGTDAWLYDLVVAADTTEDHVHIENLSCGDYYIYMIGYDTAFSDSVFGGIPFTVSQDASGEVQVDVPVTE